MIFLFSTMNPDSELKMIGFCLSKNFFVGEVLHEIAGARHTIALEVMQGGDDEKCDAQVAGVITFLLLIGDAPFGGCGRPELLCIGRKQLAVFIL